MTTSPARPALLLVLILLLAACGSTGVGVSGPGSSEGVPTDPVPSDPLPAAPVPSVTPGVPEDSHAQALLELDLARADWAAAGLVTYSYELTRQCFCDPSAIGPWTVEVVDGLVTRVIDTDGADVGVSGGPLEFGPVESLHDLIGELLAASPESSTPSGSYDAMGLPQALYVDPEPTMADEEATFTATLVTGGGGFVDPAGSMIEPLSEASAWAVGQPVDPADAFVADPVCGPTDALLGYVLTGTFVSDEGLDDATARLDALGLQVTRTDTAVTATGTTMTGAPVQIVVDGTQAVVTLELETIPAGYDLPIASMCG